ncbi:hypothetical protein ACIQNG_35410 [Streptomyces sp. NPDC091377]|uniref:hypothetical protein n=1 Tax=Streptomyces sp. NPDC091377 TaxID=3365995 RepID=UPI003821A0E0
MHSMTLPAPEVDRPGLPPAADPHERDGRRPSTLPARPHPTRSSQHMPADPTTLEALRRVIADQIGPRSPGAIYQSEAGGRFEVLAVVLDPESARALLKRRGAQWALIVKDVLRPASDPVAIGTAWAKGDYLVREGREARPCGACSGKGGKTVDTSSDGVTRKHWQTCGICKGTGAAR